MSQAWIDRHSVNCIVCSELVDERDCLPGDEGEGSICPRCQRIRKAAPALYEAAKQMIRDWGNTNLTAAIQGLGEAVDAAEGEGPA